MHERNLERHAATRSERAGGAVHPERRSENADQTEKAHSALLRSIGFSKKELQTTGAAALVWMGVCGSIIAEHQSPRLMEGVDESAYSAEQLPSQEEMKNALKQAIGHTYFYQQLLFDRVDRGSHDAEARINEISITEPESMAGHRAVIQKLLTQTYPRGWATPEAVRSVSIVTPHELGPTIVGDCHWHAGQPSDIRVSADSTRSPYEVSDHELAHANAFAKTGHTSPETVIEMAYRTNQRVNAPDRIRFYDSELNKFTDPEENIAAKMHEYWASLMNFALQIPASSQEEWEIRFIERAIAMNRSSTHRPTQESDGRADLKLALDAFRAMDPNFKPWEAGAKRDQIIIEGERKRIFDVVTARISSIPNQVIRTVLSERLHEGKSSLNEHENLFLSPDQFEGMQPQLGSESEQLAYEEGRDYLEKELKRVERTLESTQRHSFETFRALMWRIDEIRQGSFGLRQHARLVDALNHVQRFTEEIAEQMRQPHETSSALTSACGAYPGMIQHAAEIAAAREAMRERRAESRLVKTAHGV